MKRHDIKCKYITNSLYILPSSCVNLVKSRGFFTSPKHIQSNQPETTEIRWQIDQRRLHDHVWDIKHAWLLQ